MRKSNAYSHLYLPRANKQTTSQGHTGRLNCCRTTQIVACRYLTQALLGMARMS